MIEIRRVQVVRGTAWIAVGVAGIQDDVERLTAAQRDRVGVVRHVIAGHVAQQAGVDADHMHRDAERSQRLVLRHVQIGDAQQRLAADRDVDDRWQRL